jgi:hypothetical protein
VSLSTAPRRSYDFSSADGPKKGYNGDISPLGDGAFELADKKTMGCFDYHNRVGHPFRGSERAVGIALAECEWVIENSLLFDPLDTETDNGPDAKDF